MIIFKKVKDIQQQLQMLKKEGKTIVFVPTMGALHAGHLSLIKLAQGLADVTVCSIFINPTQFNDQQDFEKYPVTIDKDIALLEKENTNILFLPPVPEMYPDGQSLSQPYALGFVETILEGAFRPGHFQGVCQVVDRLLQIIQPDFMVMGQKDYQQIMVVKKMMELKGHHTQLIVAPTQREASGLARSSRNMRLSETEKKHAIAIYKGLTFIKENISKKSIDELKQEVTGILVNSGFHKIDYIAVCDAGTLQPLTHYDSSRHTIALIAAFMGEIRLIDNMLL